MAFLASHSPVSPAYPAFRASPGGRKDSDVPTFHRERPVVPASPDVPASPVDQAFPDVPAFRAGRTGRVSAPAGLPCGNRLRELPESGPASAQVVMIDGADQAAERADPGPVPVAQVVPAGQAIALVGVASVPVAPAD